MWNPNNDMFRGMYACWEAVADWYSRALHHMIDNEGVEAIFSHYHAIDLQTCVEQRNVPGGPAPEAVKQQIASIKQFIRNEGKA